MKYYVGMDVGATTMRIKLADENGNILLERESEGGSVNVLGYDYVANLYRTGLNAALGEKGLAIEDCICLCAGACGIDSDELQETYTKMLCDIGFPRERLRMYNDCGVLVHIEEDQNLIAVVSGTGSVMMGRRASDGKEARFGGRGHLLSDDGSAFYMVKEAIIRMVRYLDGYGDCEYLLRHFQEVSGLITRGDIGRLYQDNCISSKNNISQYAPVVTEAAEHGDPGALEIMELSAKGLLMGVEAVGNALELTADDEVTIVYWGSILEKVPMVSNRLTELIHEKYPKAKMMLPTGGAVDVALNIAMRQ